MTRIAKLHLCIHTTWQFDTEEMRVLLMRTIANTLGKHFINTTTLKFIADTKF